MACGSRSDLRHQAPRLAKPAPILCSSRPPGTYAHRNVFLRCIRQWPWTAAIGQYHATARQTIDCKQHSMSTSLLCNSCGGFPGFSMFGFLLCCPIPILLALVGAMRVRENRHRHRKPAHVLGIGAASRSTKHSRIQSDSARAASEHMYPQPPGKLK